MGFTAKRRSRALKASLLLIVLVACQSGSSASNPAEDQTPQQTSVPTQVSLSPTLAPAGMNTPSPQPVSFYCVDAAKQNETQTPATELLKSVEESVGKLSSFRVDMDIQMPGPEEAQTIEAKYTYQWSADGSVEVRFRSDHQEFPSYALLTREGRVYLHDTAGDWYEIERDNSEAQDAELAQLSGMRGVIFASEFFDPDFVDHLGGADFNVPFESMNSHQVSSTHLGVNWLIIDPETCLPSHFVKRGGFFNVDGIFVDFDQPVDVRIPTDDELVGTMNVDQFRLHLESLGGQ